ncbi:MAG: phosphate acyltransferase PlsX [Clostridiales bacterium]|nr:phosphate acyltransferase PlsX [Clostridiales bacterium]
MKIVIDAMGGDNAPDEIIKGVVEVADEVDAELILVGIEKVIKEKLEEYDEKKNITIKNATEVITMEEVPTKAIKSKKDSSMVVGLNMIKEKEADIFISAGSTGALLTGALLNVGRIKGISRPALATVLPSQEDKFLLLDMGANANCKPEYLAQFAKMGAIYMEKTMGVKNPKVGLVNVGTEEEKGSDLAKSAHKLLKESDLNFVGNIEGRDLMMGTVDVAVCDGFTGNVILKTLEGFGLAIFKILGEEIGKSLKNKVGALMMKPSLRALKHKMDYSEYGGALLLGIDGGVIKCHGSSKAKAVTNAIKQAYEFTKNDTIETIRKQLK